MIMACVRCHCIHDAYTVSKNPPPDFAEKMNSQLLMNKTDGPSGHIRFPQPPPRFLGRAGPDWASLRFTESRLGIAVVLQTSVPVCVLACVCTVGRIREGAS